MRIKLSPGEHFINWFPFETKLYIRGERGKTRGELDALYSEVAKQFNDFYDKVLKT